jgi:AhpD family alkylhydroperoxidase
MAMTADRYHRHPDGTATDKLADLREPTKRLRRQIPDVFKGFLDISQATMTDGALEAKHKELIALALAVAEHCEGCIAYHARGAAARGATEAEVAEALGVTILLGGGPAASDYAPRALEAFREFAGTD